MVTIMCFVVSEKNPEKCRIVSVLRSLKFYHQFNFITIQAAKLILSNKYFCWCLACLRDLMRNGRRIFLD